MRVYVGQPVALLDGGLRRPAIVTDMDYRLGKHRDRVRIFLPYENQYLEVSKEQLGQQVSEGVIPQSFDSEFLQNYVNMEDPQAWVALQTKRNLFLATKAKASKKAKKDEIEVEDPADVLKLKREELLVLIEQEDLDIDPDEFTGRSGLKNLRQEVIDSLWDDEDEDDEEEDEDDEDEDDEDEDDDEEDDEDEITEEDIDGMNRKELVAFVEEEEVDVDPDEYKGNKKLQAFRDAVKEAIFDEDDEDEDDDDDEDDEEDEDDEDVYTRGELAKMKKDALIDIILEMQDDDDEDDDEEDDEDDEDEDDEEEEEEEEVKPKRRRKK